VGGRIRRIKIEMKKDEMVKDKGGRYHLLDVRLWKPPAARGGFTIPPTGGALLVDHDDLALPQVQPIVSRGLVVIQHHVLLSHLTLRVFGKERKGKLKKIDENFIKIHQKLILKK